MLQGYSDTGVGLYSGRVAGWLVGRVVCGWYGGRVVRGGGLIGW